MAASSSAVVSGCHTGLKAGVTLPKISLGFQQSAGWGVERSQQRGALGDRRDAVLTGQAQSIGLVWALVQWPLLAESGHRAQTDRMEGWQCRLPTRSGHPPGRTLCTLLGPVANWLVSRTPSS